MKLNTLNGYNETVQTPTNSVSFMIDKSGEVRVAETSEDNLSAVHYKDPKTQQWRKLIEYDNVTGHGFSPAFIAPDGQFYVTAAKKSDTVSVFRFDLEKISWMTRLSSLQKDLISRVILFLTKKKTNWAFITKAMLFPPYGWMKNGITCKNSRCRTAKHGKSDLGSGNPE
jgi:6-phosphogluconolactonase (cycloisomerase 2 family)